MTAARLNMHNNVITLYCCLIGREVSGGMEASITPSNCPETC